MALKNYGSGQLFSKVYSAASPVSFDASKESVERRQEVEVEASAGRSLPLPCIHVVWLYILLRYPLYTQCTITPHFAVFAARAI